MLDPFNNEPDDLLAKLLTWFGAFCWLVVVMGSAAVIFIA